MNRSLLQALFFILALVPIADAKVKVKGTGDALRFDAAGIPAKYRPAFDLMNRKCGTCHSLAWTVRSIQTGKAAVTGQPFDKQAIKAYGIKMLRKPDANINRQEVRDIIIILNFLLDQNSGKQ